MNACVFADERDAETLCFLENDGMKRINMHNVCINSYFGRAPGVCWLLRTNCERIYCGKCRLTTGDVYGRMVSEEKLTKKLICAIRKEENELCTARYSVGATSNRIVQAAA